MESAISECLTIGCFSGIDHDSFPKSKLLNEMAGGVGEFNTGLLQEYLDNSLNILNTEFRHNIKEIRFNSPLKDGAINIYLLEGDPNGYFSNIKGGCGYLGYRNIIMCDIKFTKEFTGLSKFEQALNTSIEDDGSDPVLQASHRISLLRSYSSASFVSAWLIGHEIGHIAHRHGTAHFDSNIFEESLSVNQELEHQADRFSVNAIKTTELAEKMLIALGGILQRHHLKLCSIKHEHTIEECQDVFYVQKSSTSHPPMLIRAIEFTEEIDKQYLPIKQPWIQELKSRVKYHE